MNINEAIEYAKSRRNEWSDNANVPTDIAVLYQLAKALEYVLDRK